VIVVEHDEDAIRAADHIVDIGPGAGVHGGEVVAQGTLADILKRRARSPANTCPASAHRDAGQAPQPAPIRTS
jgi:excinuclease ABC subunit A